MHHERAWELSYQIRIKGFSWRGTQRVPDPSKPPRFSQAINRIWCQIFKSERYYSAKQVSTTAMDIRDA
jgi:hypothetical protein